MVKGLETIAGRGPPGQGGRDKAGGKVIAFQAGLLYPWRIVGGRAGGFWWGNTPGFVSWLKICGNQKMIAIMNEGGPMKGFISLLLAIAAFCSLASPREALAGQQLTLLIHPYLPPSELYKKFPPLANYLSGKTGKEVIVKVSKEYKAHIEAVGTDQMDLDYMGPVSYVEMVEKYGKKPLLACQAINGKPFLYGMITVKADSPLKTLADLAGKRFAFVDHESTMGYVMPRFMLHEAGVELKHLGKADFLNSHPNVAQAVLYGYYEAGAVKDDVFYAYQKRGLKMLATSPPVREHLFLASAKMPKALAASIRQALLDLHDPLVLTAIHPGLTGLVPVKDEDYDNLRQVMQTVQHIDR